MRLRWCAAPAPHQHKDRRAGGFAAPWRARRSSPELRGYRLPPAARPVHAMPPVTPDSPSFLRHAALPWPSLACDRRSLLCYLAGGRGGPCPRRSFGVPVPPGAGMTSRPWPSRCRMYSQRRSRPAGPLPPRRQQGPPRGQRHPRCALPVRARAASATRTRVPPPLTPPRPRTSNRWFWHRRGGGRGGGLRVRRRRRR